jgi:hypothetical protein
MFRTHAIRLPASWPCGIGVYREGHQRAQFDYIYRQCSFTANGGLRRPFAQWTRDQLSTKPVSCYMRPTTGILDCPPEVDVGSACDPRAPARAGEHRSERQRSYATGSWSSQGGSLVVPPELTSHAGTLTHRGRPCLVAKLPIDTKARRWILLLGVYTSTDGTLALIATTRDRDATGTGPMCRFPRRAP